MNFLRKIFEETGKLVEKGKPLSWAYPVWEAADTIFFSTNNFKGFYWIRKTFD